MTYSGYSERHPAVFLEDIKSEMFIDECQNEVKTNSHASEILGKVNGESYSFSDVLPALKNYQMKKVRSYPSNTTLEIGALIIPITVLIKVIESKPKTWDTACAHNINEKPKRSTTCCMNDELQTKVSPEDVIPALKYGTTLLPYSQDDKQMYQLDENRMILLGFTKAEKIQRYFYSGDNSRYVFGQRNNESAGEALAAFIQALHDTYTVAVVCYISTARSAPVIGFLSPRIKPHYECFVFVALPFREDLRHFIFTPLDSDSKNIPTEDQLEAVDELISAMDLTAPVDSDDDDEILQPKYIINPYVQRLYQCIQYKAYHPEKPLPEIELRVQAIVNPEPKLLKRAEWPLIKMRYLFPIKEYIPKKPCETNSHLFSDSKSDEFTKNYSADEDTLEVKFNISEAKLEDTVTDKFTEVGSGNPVRDMQYLINNQTLSFNERKAFASQETEMEEVLEVQIKEEPDMEHDVTETAFASEETQMGEVLNFEIKVEPGIELDVKEKLLSSRETQTKEVRNSEVREDRDLKLDVTVDPSLQRHLKNMLLSGTNHDITIIVRNREFKAHKDMLQARSPVFAAMFKHNTRESNSISIDDCDPDAFGEFLHYVYTGTVENLTVGRALELYCAADKHDFSGLKKVCLQFLEASLCNASICDVISLATRHGEYDLLKKAISFFSENAIQILQTVEWQQFAAKNFVNANELYIQAFTALKKQK